MRVAYPLVRITAMRAVDEEMWLIDAAEGRGWREMNYQSRPAWLVTRIRLAPTAGGLAVTGVQVERRDGRPLTARDLRTVKLPPAWVLFGESAEQWFAPGETAAAPVAAARSGARGYGDAHWLAVYRMWVRAMESAPRTPVRWMLASGRWPVSDATMRRWIARARERAAELGWDKAAQPQQVSGFLRHDDQRPAAEERGSGRD